MRAVPSSLPRRLHRDAACRTVMEHGRRRTCSSALFVAQCPPRDRFEQGRAADCGSRLGAAAPAGRGRCRIGARPCAAHSSSRPGCVNPWRSRRFASKWLPGPGSRRLTQRGPPIRGLGPGEASGSDGCAGAEAFRERGKAHGNLHPAAASESESTQRARIPNSLRVIGRGGAVGAGNRQKRKPRDCQTLSRGKHT